MYYQEIPPTPHSRGLVKCYWVLQSGGAHDERNVERVLPDGCVEVIFNFSDAFHHLRDNQAAASQPAALVVGQMRGHMLIRPGRNIDLFAIRFRPGGAFPFFGFPLRELTDVADDLTSLPDPEFQTMLSALADVPETRARVDAVERTLARRASRNGPRDILVGAALELLREPTVRRSITGLADRLGVGMRQLERRFDRAVGLPPKILDRIFRFQRLLHTLQAPRDTVPMVRPSHGYYDESHLIREFKTFTGQTPADYATDWHALSDQFIGRP